MIFIYIFQSSEASSKILHLNPGWTPEHIFITELILKVIFRGSVSTEILSIKHREVVGQSGLGAGYVFQSYLGLMETTWKISIQNNDNNLSSAPDKFGQIQIWICFEMF